MGRSKSPAHAQQFLSAHDQINVLLQPRRHRLNAISYRHTRSDAFAIWNDITSEIQLDRTAYLVELKLLATT